MSSLESSMVNPSARPISTCPVPGQWPPAGPGQPAPKSSSAPRGTLGKRWGNGRRQKKASSIPKASTASVPQRGLALREVPRRRLHVCCQPDSPKPGHSQPKSCWANTWLVPEQSFGHRVLQRSAITLTALPWSPLWRGRGESAFLKAWPGHYDRD